MCAAHGIGTGTRRSRLWPLLVTSAILALALVVLSLAWLTIDRAPTMEAGAMNRRALAPFWIAAGLSWSVLTVLAITLIRRERTTTLPRERGLMIVAVAVAARLVVLFAHQPSLSDDVYRYVFDGRNLASGANPYLVLPEARADAPDERYPGERALATRVNNAEMHTIYLPVSQWAFAGAALTLPRSATDPLCGAFVVRAMMVVAETALLLMLLVALRRTGRSTWWLALYAWHPLPLSEIAGSGHQDALGLALLAGALVLHQVRPRAVPVWTMTVALAALVKPVALPAAAFMLRRRGWRAWLVGAVSGTVVTAALAGPLLLTDHGEPLGNLRETASRFALKWAHFGPVYEPLLALIETATPEWTNDPQEQLARKICAALLAVVAVVLWARSRDPWRSCVHLFVAMVLLAPAVHPWYLLWALALVPMAPSATAWVLSLTLPWGYAVLGDTVEWTVAPWVMVCAYAPVGLALIRDLWPASREAGRRSGAGS